MAVTFLFLAPAAEVFAAQFFLHEGNQFGVLVQVMAEEADAIFVGGGCAFGQFEPVTDLERVAPFRWARDDDGVGRESPAFLAGELDAFWFHGVPWRVLPSVMVLTSVAHLFLSSSGSEFGNISFTGTTTGIAPLRRTIA